MRQLDWFVDTGPGLDQNIGFNTCATNMDLQPSDPGDKEAASIGKASSASASNTESSANSIAAIAQIGSKLQKQKEGSCIATCFSWTLLTYALLPFFGPLSVTGTS